MVNITLRGLTAGSLKALGPGYAYDKEKREALDAWGARLSRIVSGLGLVRAERGEA